MIWLFIVSLACALTGAKLVFAAIILINFAVLVIYRNKVRIGNLLLLTCSAYFCYWILFPGIFVYNFNLDLSAYSSMLRISYIMLQADLPYLQDVVKFLSQYKTGDYIGIRTVEDALKSDVNIVGIAAISGYLQIIAGVGLWLAPFWVYRLNRLGSVPYLNLKKLSIIMVVAILASTAGGLFIFTFYFWFFFSFALYLLTILLLKVARPVSNYVDNRRMLPTTPL